VAPQVIVQILAVLFQPRHREIDFNEDESKGRAVCRSDGDLEIAQDLTNWGYALFAFLVVALLTMAHQSRSMPSLFNESKTIFDSTFTTVIILIMGVAVILVTDDSETSPSVSYLVLIFVVLSITLNTSVRIVMPKLRMIWRGETIIVSQLVIDHAKEVRKSMKSTTSNSMGATDGSRGHGTGVVYDDSFTNESVRPSHKATSSALAGHSTTYKEERTSELHPLEAGETERLSPTNVSESDAQANEVMGKLEQVSVLAKVAENYEAKAKLNGSKKKEIVIDSSKAPSRRLLLKMVDLQEHYGRLTQRIMSGMAVSQEDWEHARSLTGRVGHIFNDEVVFAWEGHIAEEEEEGEQDAHLSIHGAKEDSP